jgi:adenosyl cobinamide kinase/adenosyl cobinamide phosphate guanylyltransferase
MCTSNKEQQIQISPTVFHVNSFTNLLFCLGLLFNFALEYATRRVWANQVGFKLSGKHQLLVYADYVNILGGNIHSVKKNTEDLVIVTKEIGLEVNAEKTKYMVMYRNQNARHNHNINIDNKSFEWVEEFKYL